MPPIPLITPPASLPAAVCEQYFGMASFSSYPPSLWRSANRRKAKTGSLLHELLTVLTLVIVLGGGLLWLFVQKDEQSENANRFQLTRLRSAIADYRRFTGEYPRHLTDLTSFDPAVSYFPQAATFTLVSELPNNELTDSAKVQIISNSPAILSDVTNLAGWLYNPETGEVWIDHTTQYFE